MEKQPPTPFQASTLSSTPCHRGCPSDVRWQQRGSHSRCDQALEACSPQVASLRYKPSLLMGPTAREQGCPWERMRSCSPANVWFSPVLSETRGGYQQHCGVSDDVAMVAVGSLLSNRPELQEVAKVFSRVLKQMDVYLNLECKYTVGGVRENIHTQTTY